MPKPLEPAAKFRVGELVVYEVYLNRLPALVLEDRGISGKARVRHYFIRTLPPPDDSIPFEIDATEDMLLKAPPGADAAAVYRDRWSLPSPAAQAAG